MNILLFIILLAMIPFYSVADSKFGEFESLNLPCSRLYIWETTQKVALEKFPEKEEGINKPIQFIEDIEKGNLSSVEDDLVIIKMVHLMKDVRELENGMRERYREMVKVTFNNKCEVINVENVSDTGNVIVN